MAKANKTAATNDSVLSITATTDAANLAYGDHKVAVADVSPAGITYLLDYGLGKSLQDSVSGVRKEIAESTSDDWSAFAVEAGFLADTAKDDGAIKTVTDAVVQARMAKRLAAIIAGTVGHTNRGPQVRGIEKYYRDQAEKTIRASAAKKKLPVAKGEDLRAQIDALLAGKHGDSIRAAAQAAFDADAALAATVDLD